MKLTLLASLTILFMVPTAASAQSVARANPSSNLISQTEISDDQILATRAITALERLDKDVLVYRSIGDFEENSAVATARMKNRI